MKIQNPKARARHTHTLERERESRDDSARAMRDQLWRPVTPETRDPRTRTYARRTTQEAGETTRAMPRKHACAALALIFIDRINKRHTPRGGTPHSHAVCVVPPSFLPFSLFPQETRHGTALGSLQPPRRSQPVQHLLGERVPRTKLTHGHARGQAAGP